MKQDLFTKIAWKKRGVLYNIEDIKNLELQVIIKQLLEARDQERNIITSKSGRGTANRGTN